MSEIVGNNSDGVMGKIVGQIGGEKTGEKGCVTSVSVCLNILNSSTCSTKLVDMLGIGEILVEHYVKFLHEAVSSDSRKFNLGGG